MVHVRPLLPASLAERRRPVKARSRRDPWPCRERKKKPPRFDRDGVLMFRAD